MMLILDGNSGQVAHDMKEIRSFRRQKKLVFVAALDLIKCLKQIKLRVLDGVLEYICTALTVRCG